MRATQILRQFEGELRDVHLARSRAVFAAVRMVLRSGRLSLTCLGRAIAERTSPKHGIKRIDRLLGNARLHREQFTFYRAIARRVVGSAARPVILVDWTSVTPKLWALVAAVPFEGRALVIYAETHSIAEYLKPHVNAGFLRAVRSVLPDCCRPIVVTDAGFRSPWMKLVEGMGWDYISRVRHGTLQYIKGIVWMGLVPLWRRTRTEPTDLGHFELGRQARYPCRLVGIRKANALLKPTSPRGSGIEPGGRRKRRTALEPWLLATSLSDPAKAVVAMYRQRMHIEETFRDAKSSRFGISLCHARTSSADRANVLVLLASLSHLIAVLVGMAAEAAGLHRQFQANTVRNKRVLALATLGRMIAASNEAIFLRLLRKALRTTEALTS